MNVQKILTCGVFNGLMFAQSHFPFASDSGQFKKRMKNMFMYVLVVFMYVCNSYMKYFFLDFTSRFYYE